jgi:hypothetical protein
LLSLELNSPFVTDDCLKVWLEYAVCKDQALRRPELEVEAWFDKLAQYLKVNFISFEATLMLLDALSSVCCEHGEQQCVHNAHTTENMPSQKANH